MFKTVYNERPDEDQERTSQSGLVRSRAGSRMAMRPHTSSARALKGAKGMRVRQKKGARVSARTAELLESARNIRRAQILSESRPVSRGRR